MMNVLSKEQTAKNYLSYIEELTFTQVKTYCRKDAAREVRCR